MDKELNHSPGETPERDTMSDEELMEKLSDLSDDAPASEPVPVVQDDSTEQTPGQSPAELTAPEPIVSEDTLSEANIDIAEDPFLSENTPDGESDDVLPVICSEDDTNADENTDITTSDTMFFAPVAGATAEVAMDATQIVPGDALSEALLEPLSTECDEVDHLAPAHDIYEQNSLDPHVPTPELSPQEQEERKAIEREAYKAARKEHRAQRRARLEQEDVPRARNIFTKIWQVLRFGDGFFGIPHLLSTAVWLALIISIGTSLGRTLWLCAADVLALGKTPHEITITIEPEDEFSDVTDKLHKAGLIRYPKLFTKFAELTEKDENIFISDEEPITVTFGSDHVYDYNALINALSYKGGSTVTLEVTIPEGYSCAQIFELLQQKGVCSVWALEVYCTEYNMDDYWFLQEIPQEKRNHKYSLEGFLFPDTYEFYKDDEPERVIDKFLENFNRKFTQRMIDKYVALQSETGLNLTLYEVMTMASMVEKEKAADLEGYKIASVFYNRLRKPAQYPCLDSDATINYAIDYYNKGELITDEQINASPYHTYTHPGLPPTPIANPGLSSIDAALEPYGQEAGKDQYYYFLLDRSINRHVFSVTLAEHEKLEKELGYK